MKFNKMFTRQDMIVGGLAALAFTVIMAEPSFAATGASGQVAHGGFDQVGTGTDNIGGGVLAVFQNTLFGNIGLVAGIAFAAFGAYQWLVAQNTWVGIGSIIFGAVLALSDNLMSAVYNTIGTPLVNLLGDGSTN